MIKVSIIIISYNTKKLIQKCLESLFDGEIPVKFEVILLDNASHDETIEMVKKEFSQVKIIANSENKGFGTACNQAAEIAQGEYLLFLNSDAFLYESSLEKMIHYLEENEDVGIVGAHQVDSKGNSNESFGFFPTLVSVFIEALLLNKIPFVSQNFKMHYLPGKLSLYQKNQIVDYVSGACLLISKKDFESIKGFDEGYFFYVEDVDLAYRLKKEKGLKAVYLSEALVEHEGGKSASYKTAPILEYYFNGLQLFFKNYRSSTSLLFLQFILFVHISIRIIIVFIKKIFGLPKESAQKTLSQYKKALKTLF